ncbi:hypothetical protein O6H91_20G073400 [Diphasiastrum complanatum]|uniref:Uncharacterized protein n=1 Tax=Diphasiastrum complanatum TaxID=34168 RepID=A0ACC2ARZ0_DIPCM|nr:hypothetical protein O6H91_20G073400 [Diphasiastrum complanatum]
MFLPSQFFYAPPLDAISSLRTLSSFPYITLSYVLSLSLSPSLPPSARSLSLSSLRALSSLSPHSLSILSSLLYSLSLSPISLSSLRSRSPCLRTLSSLRALSLWLISLCPRAVAPRQAAALSPRDVAPREYYQSKNNTAPAYIIQNNIGPKRALKSGQRQLDIQQIYSRAAC